ncbi:MAG TPA: EthD domain-containing protein, partial [Acidimicrobiales bacterium]
MKYLVLLAARGGAAGVLGDAVVREGERIASHPGIDVVALRQVSPDPFGNAVPCMRPFDATLDVRGDDDALVLAALAGITDRLDDVVHGDLSCVLAGTDHVVIPCEPTPVRYQYVMRRKIGTTHEQYLDHYVHRHAQFGRITPGIAGYTQFHVDADVSRAAATAAGAGLWRADSVSELHLASVDTFLGALAESNPGYDAGADEERFVDR